MIKKYSALCLIVMIGASLISCGEDELSCEENRTGDIVVTNDYVETSTSRRVIQVFVDSTPRSSNTPGDYTVQAGETITITLNQGIHTVLVYIDFGSSGSVMRDLLDDREIDLDACDQVPLNYGL